MYAPSACNRRPWHFIIVTNRDLLQKLSKVHPHTWMVKDSAAAIVLCADLSRESRMSEGFYPQDCGAATQNMLLQAADLEIGSCWCGIYPRQENVDKMRDLLQVDKTLIPINVIALGYANEEFGSRGYYEKELVTYYE